MTDNFADDWDLAEVLQERKQPTEEVTIYLAEDASAIKSELVERSASAKGDDLAAIEKQIAVVDKEIESKKYIVTLEAIPSRMIEDIETKGLVEFPMHLDLMGRDSDAVNVLARNKKTTILRWNAQIKNVTNPQGNSKTRDKWTAEMTESFHDAIGAGPQKAINQAIADLQSRVEEYSVKSKNVDFS